MDRRAFLGRSGVGLVATLLGTGTVVSNDRTGGFSTGFDTTGWGDWAKDGVSNLHWRNGRGIVQAATNTYPSDRRAVVFHRDQRARDGYLESTVTRLGVGPGLVLRRTGPDTYYAAVYEREQGLFQIIARVDGEESVLAALPVGAAPGQQDHLTFVTTGTDPTDLEARLAPTEGTDPVQVQTTDETPELQAAGDPGVLGTSETGFRSGPGWRTPLGTQSARAVWVTDPFHSAAEGGGLRDTPLPLDRTRRTVTEQTSTTAFDSVTFSPFTAVGTTQPSTVAATAVRPTTLDGRPGALVSVVSDVACDVTIEVSSSASFTDARVIDGGRTNRFSTVFAEVAAPHPGDRFYWRPILDRGDASSIGPSRSAQAMPPPGSPDQVSLAIGSCATQFGETFASIADYDPDAFIWHGDLNYLDASGPLAQTVPAFAGMWKDLLAVPELRPILDRAYFAPQRDDHDYGENDMYGEQIEPYGIEPYEGVMNPDVYYRFGGGLVDVFVPDTRRYRDDPSQPDDADKTLLGPDQLSWLLDGLRSSTAPFTLVASPGPVFNVPNSSTSWAKGYTTERDHVLDVIASEVSGRTVFVTGDTHSGAVTRFQTDEYGAAGDSLEFLEVRAAPLDIPGPGQHDPSSGENVVFSEQGKYFATVAVHGEQSDAVMDIALRRADGTPAWRDTVRTPR